MVTCVTWPPSLHRGFPSLTKPKRPCLLEPHPHPASLAPAADSLTSHVALLISSIVGILVTCVICHVSSPALRHRQWRRQGGRGEASPLRVDVQKLCNNVCAFIVMELLRITRQIHCKAVEQRATLIHRQYNRDWGTSYYRPHFPPVTKSWRRHWSSFTADKQYIHDDDTRWYLNVRSIKS